MTATLKIKDIQQLLAAGAPVAVEFTKGIEDSEAYPEPGMRAYAVGFVLHEHDVCAVRFDFAPFDEHNKAFEQSNYYDREGKPCLTAREAGQYKPQDDLYLTPDDDMDTKFTLVPTERLALFVEYGKAPVRGTYVSWLEAQVLELRSATRGLLGERTGADL